MSIIEVVLQTWNKNSIIQNNHLNLFNRKKLRIKQGCECFCMSVCTFMRDSSGNYTCKMILSRLEYNGLAKNGSILQSQTVRLEKYARKKQINQVPSQTPLE